MGSTVLPQVGMASFGNPAGMDLGYNINPKFEAETFKNLASFVPGGAPAGARPLGNSGANAFAAPVTSPANLPVNPPSLVTTGPPPAAPGSGTGQGGSGSLYGNTLQNNSGGGGQSSYGYPTNPGGNGSTLNPFDAFKNGAPNVWTDMWGGLRQAYGGNKQLATTLTTFLGNGAGWNPKAAQAMMNDIEPYFQEHMADILEAFGQSGNRFSSTAAYASGKFAADFTSHQEALYAQMYQEAINNYIRILTGTGGGENKSGGSGIMGTINGVLGLTKAGAGALTAAGVGAGEGTLATILAGLAAL